MEREGLVGKMGSLSILGAIGKLESVSRLGHPCRTGRAASLGAAGEREGEEGGELAGGTGPSAGRARRVEGGAGWVGEGVAGGSQGGKTPWDSSVAYARWKPPIRGPRRGPPATCISWE